MTDRSNATTTISSTETNHAIASTYNSLSADSNYVRVEDAMNGAYLFELKGDRVNNAAAYTSLFYQANISLPTGRVFPLKDRVEIDARPIDSMYDVYTVDAASSSGADLRANVNVNAFDQYSLSETSLTPKDNRYIMQVHGWNMDEAWKTAFGDTGFKRLYWSGYNGRFGVFNWPTYVDGAGPGAILFQPALNLTYNASEFAAWRSASALRIALNSLKNNNYDNLTVIAHSMGNVVMGEALRQWTVTGTGKLVDNYIAMQGAVASGAYGGIHPLSIATIPVTNPFRDLYAKYPVNEGDIQPIFKQAVDSGTATNFYNIYNPNDYALGDWENQNAAKGLYVLPNAGLQWPYGYEVVSTPSTEFRRVYSYTGVPPFTVSTSYDTLSFGSSNPALSSNSYEILSFLGVSLYKPIGMVPMTDSGMTSIPITDLGYDSSLPGFMDYSNHSFEWHYSAADTHIYWKYICDKSYGV